MLLIFWIETIYSFRFVDILPKRSLLHSTNLHSRAYRSIFLYELLIFPHPSFSQRKKTLLHPTPTTPVAEARWKLQLFNCKSYYTISPFATHTQYCMNRAVQFRSFTEALLLLPPPPAPPPICFSTCWRCGAASLFKHNNFSWLWRAQQHQYHTDWLAECGARSWTDCWRLLCGTVI